MYGARICTKMRNNSRSAKNVLIGGASGDVSSDVSTTFGVV